MSKEDAEGGSMVKASRRKLDVTNEEKCRWKYKKIELQKKLCKPTTHKEY